LKRLQCITRRQLAAGIAAITWAALSPHASAQSAFTAVRAQIDRNEDPWVQVIETQTDPFFAEVGTAPDIYAKARASFGNNGAFATASHQPANIGAYAESIWVDGFNIDGGVGTGILDIGVLVSGTMDGAGQPGGPGSNSYYQLYVSDSPISCDFDELSCTGTSVIPLTEAISGSRLFTVQLSFTYGQTFYIASYLGAEVLGNGFSDFYGSAHFGATAPGNTSIVGSSGVSYALASSVPEPSAALLLFAGLAVLGLIRRQGGWSVRASGAGTE
jgi:hypothetical protein